MRPTASAEQPPASLRDKIYAFECVDWTLWHSLRLPRRLIRCAPEVQRRPSLVAAVAADADATADGRSY